MNPVATTTRRAAACVPHSAWLKPGRPAPAARIRLLCVPHAGGGAATYRHWNDHLPPDIDLYTLSLPGRESRLEEVPFTSMPALLNAMGDPIRAWSDTAPRLPYALLGHSMGALIAFELAGLLAESGRPPAAVIVSGHAAPHLPSNRQLHLLPDAEFIAEVVRDSGAPIPALDDPDLRDLYLPALRADFELTETYRLTAARPLDCPLITWCGDADSGVTRQEVEQWAGFSRAKSRHRVFPGGHFFARDNPAPVLDSLQADLASLAL